MLWPDEIRRPEFDFLGGDVEVRPQELRMAASLVESMVGSFEEEDFTDDYRDAMEKLITAKAEGAVLPATEESEEKGEVIDLMTALERSVEAAKASRAEPAKPGKKKAAAEKKASSA